MGWDNTQTKEFQSTTNFLGWALTGASIGAMAGPIGAAVGAGLAGTGALAYELYNGSVDSGNTKQELIDYSRASEIYTQRAKEVENLATKRGLSREAVSALRKLSLGTSLGGADLNISDMSKIPQHLQQALKLGAESGSLKEADLKTLIPDQILQQIKKERGDVYKTLTGDNEAERNKLLYTIASKLSEQETDLTAGPAGSYIDPEMAKAFDSATKNANQLAESLRLLKESINMKEIVVKNLKVENVVDSTPKGNLFKEKSGGTN
jgi:uncharacterized protein YdbL (DUF1318 family)